MRKQGESLVVWCAPCAPISLGPKDWSLEVGQIMGKSLGKSIGKTGQLISMLGGSFDHTLMGSVEEVMKILSYQML